MARPSKAQAASIDTSPCAAASNNSPAMNKAQDSSSTGRPPLRSTRRPAQGLMAAPISSAIDSAAYTVLVCTPRLRAIGAASIAGK